MVLLCLLILLSWHDIALTLSYNLALALPTLILL